MYGPRILQNNDVFYRIFFVFNLSSSIDCLDALCVLFFPKASSMLGFSFRRLREEREIMSGSGGRAVDGLWTGGSCRNSMGGG